MAEQTVMKQISIGGRTFLTKSVCKHVQERLGLDDAVRAQAGPEGRTRKFYCKNDVVAISDGDVLTDVGSGNPIGTGWGNSHRLGWSSTTCWPPN